MNNEPTQKTPGVIQLCMPAPTPVVQGSLFPELHPWRDIRPWRRHSLVLVVAGFVYVAIGASYSFVDITPARAEALAAAFNVLPYNVWGWVWIFAGGLAIVSSRWPPISKTWGYMLLTGLSAGWSGFYAVSVFFDDSPVANLSATLSWGLVAFLWWAISGLLNPNDIRLITTADLVDEPPR